MICISINQESRRLALFDMFNAAPQCDLLEVRLGLLDACAGRGAHVQAKLSGINGWEEVAANEREQSD